MTIRMAAMIIRGIRAVTSSMMKTIPIQITNAAGVNSEAVMITIQKETAEIRETDKRRF
jgi:hypothetical protein